MKQTYLFIYVFLFAILTSFSQNNSEKTNGLFYKVSLASTLTVNKDYAIFNNDEEPFFNFSALFLNNTIGYQFDKRTSIGLNAEYNWHSQQGLHFFPTYLSFQYNIIVDDSDLFIRGGYGSLISLSNDFEKGNMYKVGLGIRGYDDGYLNSFLLGLDFTRKRFGYKTLQGLSSVSVFMEFMFF
ncbi:hypothetical protein [Gelatiniphilus marinus]|uniref:Outer membrane protein beta-barrel domain-containing protein n=1 Tax=Gelatiniphilus marinus TaxID=1759464 RepID=A0ABW5JRW6_9FLAO